MMKPMNYAAADLLAFADQLLQTAGLPPDKAQGRFVHTTIFDLPTFLVSYML